MPLRLEVKRELLARSDRVKCVDIHPKEPWILSGLYSGHLFIWNSVTESLVKTFEVTDVPIRCAKFIPRKQWIVCGADDMQIRIYNYHTMEKIKTFESHTDYLRCLAVHPTLPYILSSSDDMTIKLWDWDKNFECTQVFEGHAHYVMQVAFNPKDPSTFASASLDRTIKVWGVTSREAHFTLEGHERGVNCVSYFPGGDRPFLVSGADDLMVKVWDYQTKSCVATLDGHTNNISTVLFHPVLPVIISGAEDGTVRIWHSTTYRLENTLNYGMERVWSLASLPPSAGSTRVAVGYDEGTVVIRLGQEEPVVSMDQKGKVLWAKNHEIQQANVKSVGKDEIVDGEALPVPVKDLSSCEIYPQSLAHNSNGRLACVCGDGEYTIYTALSFKNKSFGNALEFAWANDSNTYAIRESNSKVKTFKNFKEAQSFRPNFPAEGVFGGQLLGIRSSEFIDFYDWDECRVVRRIEVVPLKVYWSESGDLVVLVCENSYYVLRYNRDLVAKFFDQDVATDDQGIDNAFELEEEVNEKVSAGGGRFVGDCFIYCNAAGRLNYYVGGQVITLAHLDRKCYMLGYLQKENRVYLIDKQHNILSYELLVSVLAYQTAIVRQDFDAASLEDVPAEQHNKLARFLESQDLKEEALRVSNDPEHRFELALQLGKLQLAKDILLQSPSEQKWRQLSDLALAEFDLPLVEECSLQGQDIQTLLLLYTSQGNQAGVEKLIELAKHKGHQNVAFVCLLLLGKVDECIQLLVDTGRVPEAAFMARTYAPSSVPAIVTAWRENLSMVSASAAEALADPSQYPELFDDLDLAIQAEKHVRITQTSRPRTKAADYLATKSQLFRDFIQEARDGTLSSGDVAVGASPQEQEDFLGVMPAPPQEEEEEEDQFVEPEIELEVEEEPEPEPVVEQPDASSAEIDLLDTFTPEPQADDVLAGVDDLMADLDDGLEGLDLSSSAAAVPTSQETAGDDVVDDLAADLDALDDADFDF